MADNKTILEKLEGSISLEDVSKRKQGNVNLSYIESHKAIRNANEVFGFDGWDSETIYCKESCKYVYQIAIWENGKKSEKTKDGWKVGYTAKVRITARIDGQVVVREGCGDGSGIGVDLFDVIEGANKEAESDAEKRALRKFGDMFALCLYNKNSELHGAKGQTKTYPKKETVKLPEDSREWVEFLKKQDNPKNYYHEIKDSGAAWEIVSACKKIMYP
jgi:recombination DNA repair RAD52 pathway protein